MRALKILRALVLAFACALAVPALAQEPDPPFPYFNSAGLTDPAVLVAPERADEVQSILRNHRQRNFQILHVALIPHLSSDPDAYARAFHRNLVGEGKIVSESPLVVLVADGAAVGVFPALTGSADDIQRAKHRVSAQIEVGNYPRAVAAVSDLLSRDGIPTPSATPPEASAATDSSVDGLWPASLPSFNWAQYHALMPIISSLVAGFAICALAAHRGARALRRRKSKLAERKVLQQREWDRRHADVRDMLRNIESIAPTGRPTTS